MPPAPHAPGRVEDADPIDNNRIASLSQEFVGYVTNISGVKEEDVYCHIEIEVHEEDDRCHFRFSAEDVRERPIPADNVVFSVRGLKISTPRRTIMYLQDCVVDVINGQVDITHPLVPHYKENQAVSQPWDYNLSLRLLVVKTNIFGDADYASETIQNRRFVRAFPYTPQGWEDARSYAQALIDRNQGAVQTCVTQVYQGLFAIFLAAKSYTGIIVRPGDSAAELYHLNIEEVDVDTAEEE